MSRSSGYLAGKKSRHGTQTERKRARTGYILRTQTERLANLVALRVKVFIKEDVTNELDQRGYHQRCPDIKVAGRGDREGGESTDEVSQEPDKQPNQEAEEPVEEEKKCPYCDHFPSEAESI